MNRIRFPWACTSMRDDVADVGAAAIEYERLRRRRATIGASAIATAAATVLEQQALQRLQQLAGAVDAAAHAYRRQWGEECDDGCPSCAAEGSVAGDDDAHDAEFCDCSSCENRRAAERSQR